MNYGEIYNEIMSIVYGDTTEPVSLENRLRGSEGLIARKRKRIMERDNYWFMENTRKIPVASGMDYYPLGFNFKEEINLQLQNVHTGDYLSFMKKLRPEEIRKYHLDVNATSKNPQYYFVDFNTYRRLRFLPIPDSTDNYVATLSVGTTNTNIASTAFTYVIDGEDYDKAAVAAGTAFSSADTINTDAIAGIYWGAWLVEIDDSGTITTNSVSADQSYDSEIDAIANLSEPAYDKYPLGFVTIACNTGNSWTANTDDLVTDADTVNFYDTAFLANLKYFGFLDELSDTQETFDVTEDDLSIECSGLLVWECVKDLAQIRYDTNLIQLSAQEIQREYDDITRKNFRYYEANKGRIRYKQA